MLPEPLPLAGAAARRSARAESRTSTWMRFMEPPIRDDMTAPLLPPVAPRRQCPLRSRHGIGTALYRFGGMDSLERAGQVVTEWDERLRADLPSDLDVFDAHTHLGTDIDGMVGRPDELLGGMDRYGISRAFMFCLDEPDRHPGFRAGNDRTLEFAAGSEGRLIPFVRLALDEGP